MWVYACATNVLQLFSANLAPAVTRDDLGFCMGRAPPWLMHHILIKSEGSECELGYLKSRSLTFLDYREG